MSSEVRRRLKRSGREVAAAALAIGSTPRARWKWLTAFAGAPLPRLGTVDARRRAAEVEAFSLGAVESAGTALQSYSVPSGEDLIAIQRTATEVIAHLKSARARPLQFPPAQVRYAIHTVPGPVPGELTVVTMMETDNAVDFFRVAVADLLNRLRGILRLCRNAACGRPFVFSRSHQRFCSPQCQSRDGLQRFIARQGGKAGFAEKRSEAYYARKERALGKQGRPLGKLKRPR